MRAGTRSVNIRDFGTSPAPPQREQRTNPVPLQRPHFKVTGMLFKPRPAQGPHSSRRTASPQPPHCRQLEEPRKPRPRQRLHQVGCPATSPTPWQFAHASAFMVSICLSPSQLRQVRAVCPLAAQRSQGTGRVTGSRKSPPWCAIFFPIAIRSDQSRASWVPSGAVLGRSCAVGAISAAFLRRSACSASRASFCRAARGSNPLLQRRLAELVVERAGLEIGEHVVGVAQPLEPLGRVGVGVVALGPQRIAEPLEGAPDGDLVGRFVDAEQIVEAQALAHGGSRTTRPPGLGQAAREARGSAAPPPFIDIEKQSACRGRGDASREKERLPGLPFDELDLPTPLKAAIAARGYANPTPVQEAVLADELRGRDLLVSSRTGSGKTLAFGMVLARELLTAEARFGPAPSPLGLIVAPTRELAFQISEELSWLLRSAGARIATCVGGVEMGKELRALRDLPHLVVGTPGRLVDHLERKSLKPGALKVLVLDEADEMLDMGFRDELERILRDAPAERRTLLFSATIPKDIEQLARRYQKDAARVSATPPSQAHQDIEVRAHLIAAREREHAVVNTLRAADAQTAIVFCGTRDHVNHLHASLVERGFSAVALSGELTQPERTRALKALRDGRARVLVATDVAARGLDLPDVGIVVQADLPQNAEVWQHRSGRTGRAGRKGVSVLLVPGGSQRSAELMLRKAGAKPTWSPPPGPEQIRERDHARLVEGSRGALAGSGRGGSGGGARAAGHPERRAAGGRAGGHPARRPPRSRGAAPLGAGAGGRQGKERAADRLRAHAPHRAHRADARRVEDRSRRGPAEDGARLGRSGAPDLARSERRRARAAPRALRAPAREVRAPLERAPAREARALQARSGGRAPRQARPPRRATRARRSSRLALGAQARARRCSRREAPPQPRDLRRRGLVLGRRRPRPQRRPALAPAAPLPPRRGGRRSRSARSRSCPPRPASRSSRTRPVRSSARPRSPTPRTPRSTSSGCAESGGAGPPRGSRWPAPTPALHNHCATQYLC